ncbi:hypothetical protein Vafri_20478 [Volvox africanus]|uniref:Uncharacterized protein n=1 Tax=Volvox africanus TaxID=51714 RepID=A0A8J4BQY2_9CHLO|nr:hypothetical protein Vafri_20478 [Volvox africanus]
MEFPASACVTEVRSHTLQLQLRHDLAGTLRRCATAGVVVRTVNLRESPGDIGGQVLDGHSAWGGMSGSGGRPNSAAASQSDGGKLREVLKERGGRYAVLANAEELLNAEFILS